MYAAFAGVMLFALALALHARRNHHERDPRAFFAARGQFGALLFFTLYVGETYSIGSVLGFPGGIVASGSGMVLWFIGYILLGFPVGYVLFPRLWSVGQRTGAITLPDLFRGHYQSPGLERVVAALLVVLMLPLGVTQFIGLTGVLHILAPDLAPPAADVALAGLAFLFVAIAGLRAAALVSVLKDALMLLAIVSVAVLVGFSWHINQTHTLAEALKARSGSSPGPGFVLSTILVQALGICVTPQGTAAVFSARDPRTIRRAQIWMPVYMLLFPLLFLVAGYAITHDTPYRTPDSTFLSVATALMPDWALGLVLGAITLTALVWTGSVCLALAAIVTRNLIPGIPDRLQKRIGLAVIGGYLALSLAGAASPSTPIAGLNTLFYLGVAQLVPSIMVVVMDRRVSVLTVIAGMIAGGGVGLILRETTSATLAPLHMLNPSIVGLAVNAMIVAGGMMFGKETAQPRAG